MSTETNLDVGVWEKFTDGLTAVSEGVVGFLGRLFGSSIKTAAITKPVMAWRYILQKPGHLTGAKFVFLFGENFERRVLKNR